MSWSRGWTGSCFRLHCWVWRFLCCWRWAEGWFWQWLFNQLWSRNRLRWGRLQWFLRWFWWRDGRRLWQLSVGWFWRCEFMILKYVTIDRPQSCLTEAVCAVAAFWKAGVSSCAIWNTEPFFLDDFWATWLLLCYLCYSMLTVASWMKRPATAFCVNSRQWQLLYHEVQHPSPWRWATVERQDVESHSYRKAEGVLSTFIQPADVGRQTDMLRPRLRPSPLCAWHRVKCK